MNADPKTGVVNTGGGAVDVSKMMQSSALNPKMLELMKRIPDRAVDEVELVMPKPVEPAGKKGGETAGKPAEINMDEFGEETGVSEATVGRYREQVKKTGNIRPEPILAEAATDGDFFDEKINEFEQRVMNDPHALEAGSSPEEADQNRQFAAEAIPEIVDEVQILAATLGWDYFCKPNQIITAYDFLEAKMLRGQPLSEPEAEAFRSLKVRLDKYAVRRETYLAQTGMAERHKNLAARLSQRYMEIKQYNPNPAVIMLGAVVIQPLKNVSGIIKERMQFSEEK